MTQQQPQFRSAPFEVHWKPKRFEGQVAMFHGGAQGLGRVTARRLAQEGAKIVIVDVQDEQGKKTAADLKQETGMDAIAFSGDTSVAGAADDVVAKALKEFGQIDVLVNTAAWQMRKPFLSFTEEMMQKAMNWNLWNYVRMCKAVLPHMMERRYGRIVNIGGSAFENGTPYHSFLAGAGKGGIVGLTTTLAGEFAPFGITVNCVSPSNMDVQDDGIPNSRAGGRSPEFMPSEEDRKVYPPMGGGGPPMGRPGHPTEVAAAIAFLASPEGSYVTGQLLSVTGGVHML